MKNINNWKNFMVEFSNEILPIYQEHENTFDKNGVHGRLHISRSLIFSEYMARFYAIKLNSNIDYSAIRYAVAFHDSGRQANGIDLWEDDSENLCYDYLDKHDYNLEYCKYTSFLINKNLNNSDFNKLCVYDADVLEIMRPCCGHGERDGFRANFLNFFKFDAKYQDIRNDLIEDSWQLIEHTEDIKHTLSGNNCLYKIVNILEKNKNDYRVLKDLF